MSNLLAAMLNTLNVPTEKFGDGTGVLDNLTVGRVALWLFMHILP